MCWVICWFSARDRFTTVTKFDVVVTDGLLDLGIRWFTTTCRAAGRRLEHACSV